MGHKLESDMTEHQQDDFVSNIMTEQNINQKLVRVARIVTSNPLSEIPVIVATDAEGNVQIDAFTQFEQTYQCKVAHDVMIMFP